MPERSKGAALKAAEGVSPPGVRIPPPPLGLIRVESLAKLENAWRGGRVVEGARLLSECADKIRTVGSNPTPSASQVFPPA